MKIIRTDPYLRSVKRLFSGAELDQIDELIAERPDAGVLIPGTGGIRKIRVARKGMGKRGGARVIYYWHQPGDAAVLVDDHGALSQALEERLH